MNLTGILGLTAGGIFIVALLVFAGQKHEITILTTEVEQNAAQIISLKAQSTLAIAQAATAQKKADSQEVLLSNHIQTIEKQTVSPECQKAMDWMVLEAQSKKAKHK